MLPLSVDPVIISGIIGMGKSCSNWRKVGLQEGMRILELQGFKKLLVNTSS
jgi:hypothetical protein